MKLILTLILFSLSTLTIANQNANITGKITSVHAGNDNWYGVRFHIGSRTKDTTEGVCNSGFVYTEPGDWTENAHNNKVSVFLAAYIAGKTVSLTVVSGRNGYCKLFEGRMWD